jgi:Ca-activated chloride channel family protein
MRQRLARFLFVTITATAACRGGSPTTTSANQSAGSAIALAATPPAPPPVPTPAGGDTTTVPANTATATATKSDDGKNADHEGQFAMKKSEAKDQAQYAGVLAANQKGVGNGSAIGTITGASGTGYGYGMGAVGGGRTHRVAGHHAANAPMQQQAPATPDPVSNTESYTHHDANAWITAAKDHLSTFAADVDTASYTIARRKLNEGALPPHDAVRVEEFVNYFRYAYPAPSDAKPFSVTMDAAPSPFAKDRTIIRVGVATKALSVAQRKNANLVFLVDVSGSMQSPDKLELAKRSLRILVDNLKDGDTVSLVTYAGDTRLVLPPTGLEHKGDIMNAIEELTAGGGTGMASGIETAYDEALKGMKPGVISRVLVLTDGDANIGPSTHDEILKMIAGKVKEGVTLSTIGFGMGNYKDDMMEALADKGNGNAFYVDGLSAAKRIFQEQLGSTLEVVAKDVKLQVDFDPTLVKRYRLIGYEDRDIADNDFRNDKVDAGEIGAGHQVTALYEVELTPAAADSTAPIATTRVRWKEPDGTKATEAAYVFDHANLAASFAAAPADLRFSFAVAAFADVLRGSEDAKTWSLGDIRAIANAASATGATDTDRADRSELVSLIDRAIKVAGPTKTAIAQ